MAHTPRLLPPALVLLALVGCKPEDPQVAERPPPAVTVARVVVRKERDYDEYTGRLAAVDEVQVRARVSGYLVNWTFTPGEEVKKDQVLFEIDPDLYKADLNRTTAAIAQAEARVKRLEADYRRAERLLPTGAVTREEYDKVVGDLGEARAGVGVAKANQETSNLNLKFTKVRAPINGRISRPLVTKGNLIRADDTLLTTILSVDEAYVYFDIDEKSLLRYQRSTRGNGSKTTTPVPLKDLKIPIKVALEGDAGFPHEGTLDFAENTLDASTGTFRARGVLPNKKRIFTAGLRARVQVPVGPDFEAILVAEEAVGTEQARRFVYVVENDVAKRRTVKLGRTRGELVVIEEGLKKGDVVIVNGVQRVRPEMKVDPKLGPMPGDRPENKSGKGDKTKE
jgi:RND family efflux transporter MFP subunit